MGGNLFKDYSTKRIDNKELLELQNRIFNMLRNFNIYFVKSYSNKESHGGIDIVIKKSEHKEIKKIIEDLNLPLHNALPYSFSFLFENVQVDFIIVEDNSFDFACNYFNFNDLGNLIGRITYKFGIKFGFDGLMLPVNVTQNEKIGEIFITNNFELALSLFDLSYEKYCKGFDTLEEMFNFVSSSKYFNPQIYLLENRCHKSRIRDKKRSTYNSFLEWCEKNKDKLNKYHYDSYEERGGYQFNETVLREKIYPIFPHVEKELNSIIEKYRFKTSLKNIFNGNIISEITGLKGKELGEYFTKLKPIISEFKTIEEYQKYLENLRKIYENKC